MASNQISPRFRCFEICRVIIFQKVKPKSIIQVYKKILCYNIPDEVTKLENEFLKYALCHEGLIFKEESLNKLLIDLKKLSKEVK